MFGYYKTSILFSVDERLQPNYSASFQSVLSSSPGGRYTISTPKYGSLNFSEGTSVLGRKLFYCQIFSLALDWNFADSLLHFQVIALKTNHQHESAPKELKRNVLYWGCFCWLSLLSNIGFDSIKTLPAPPQFGILISLKKYFSVQ